MRRRDFMLGAALLGLGLPARDAWAAAPGAGDPLLALVGDRKAPALLGAAWLEQGSQQPDALRAALRSRLQRQGWTSEDDDRLPSIFAAAVADDYRNGAMVSIAGWLIAETEAQLCALAYFDQAKHP
jgi:hypothetical protein